MEYTAETLSGILGITPRSVRRRAASENWPYHTGSIKGGKRRVYPYGGLPADVKAAVDRSGETPNLPVPATSHLPAEPAGLPDIPLTEAQKRNALAKADILFAWDDFRRKGGGSSDFIRAYNYGDVWPHLKAEIGRISQASLDRWRGLVKRYGDPWVLADRRGDLTRGKTEIPDLHQRILLVCALNPNRPLVAEAVRTARSILSYRYGETEADFASESSWRRWLTDFRSRHYDIWVFRREGAKAWNDKVSFYIERDPALIGVGDILVADGHVLNFEIINPWTGKPKRMTLLLWYDMRANFPCGWEIMPTESTQCIFSALRRAIITLGKIPKVVYLDNGKAFRAKFFSQCEDFEQAGFSGLFQRLGIKPIFAWPYHGQSKTIERFFRTFSELERLSPTYVGTSIEKKPPYMMRGERLHRKVHEKILQGRGVTLDMAHRAVAAWMQEYVSRPQDGDYLKGWAPADLFEEGRGPGVNADDLRFLMMGTTQKHIYRNGIRMPDPVSGQSRFYYAPELHGRRHPVTVRYDFQAPDSVLVYDPDGNYLCEAVAFNKTHPAATVLGSAEDRERLANLIEMKRHDEKTAAGDFRRFADEEIIPATEARLERLGLTWEGPSEEKQKVIRLGTPMTPDEEARLMREVEERQRMTDELNREYTDNSDALDELPEAEDETAVMFGRLQSLREMDRYLTLIELGARGEDIIPTNWLTWMKYYEGTAEYRMHKEFYDQRKLAAVMLSR